MCAIPHSPSKHKHKQSFWKASLSGGITGGLEICITFPTEFVKTMQQLYPEYSKKGSMACVRETLAKHGPMGLYRGLSCLVFFSVPKAAVRFGSKEALDSYVFTKHTAGSIFMSGACAGALEALFVVTPMETLKVKLIHDRLMPEPKYSGFFHGVRSIYAAQGWRGIYKGPVPTVIKQSSNQAIRFTVYEEIKSNLEAMFPDSPLTLQTIIAGGIAGAASVLGNNPIDVIKTNMQGLNSAKYKGTVDCFMQIVKAEGVRGLYKGTVPRLARVVADVAITFTLFEHIRIILDKVFPN
jgi:solute carrier family 25 citrate transporter 1